MGNLGKYDYPDLELSEAVAKADQIHVDYKDKTSAGNLAKIFGMSVKGGAFPIKVKDMKKYNLIEGERGDYKLTPLGLRIVQNPNDFKARAQAFLNVELFKAMRDEFGDDPPKDMDVFKNRLMDIVKPVAEKDVSIRAARLRNRYSEALPYLSRERQVAGTGLLERANFESLGRGAGALAKANIESLGGGQPSSSPVATPFSSLDSDFYLVDRRGTPFFIGLDSASKIDLAIQYLRDAKNSLVDKKTPESKRTTKEVSD